LWLQRVNATIKDVSLKAHLHYDIVLGVLERRIDHQVDWTRYTELSYSKNVRPCDSNTPRPRAGFLRAKAAVTIQ